MRTIPNFAKRGYCVKRFLAKSFNALNDFTSKSLNVVNDFSREDEVNGLF